MTQEQKFRALRLILSRYGFGPERGLCVKGQGVRLSEDYGYDEYDVEHLFVRADIEGTIYYKTLSWRNCSLNNYENHAKASVECIYDRLMETGFKGVDKNLF